MKGTGINMSDHLDGGRGTDFNDQAKDLLVPTFSLGVNEAVT